MGLGGTDLMGNDAAGAAAAAAAATVACSICLDAVISAGGDRSTARLQCGHEFHLDCIGSAFNAKGVMQCPNCRKIEKGNWLYANGSRSLSDLSMHEWVHDEDLYDLNYSEMPFGVHWCPFGRLARATSSFEEGESSPAIALQDLLGHHAVFTEHPTTSTAHPCPYVAYVQPLQHSSTSNSHVFSGSPVDGLAYHHHWCQVPGPTDVQPHALPAIDHYYNWEHHSPGYSIHGGGTSTADQVSVSSATTRTSRHESDGLPRTGHFIRPFVPGHRSRTAGSFVSSSIPPYASTSESQAHVHEHRQHHSSPGMHGAVFTGVRRPGGTRSVASAGATSLSPDNTGRYYLFPPTQSPNQSFRDVDNSEGNQFYAWESDRFAIFPPLHVDRESGWWGPFPRHWHGSERSSTQRRPEGGSSHRPVDARMRPFI